MRRLIFILTFLLTLLHCATPALANENISVYYVGDPESGVVQAVDLSGITRPLAWTVWASTELGSRISPLHNRFPITIRSQAFTEAETLNLEKVDL